MFMVKAPCSFLLVILRGFLTAKIKTHNNLHGSNEVFTVLRLHVHGEGPLLLPHSDLEGFPSPGSGAGVGTAVLEAGPGGGLEHVPHHAHLLLWHPSAQGAGSVHQPHAGLLILLVLLLDNFLAENAVTSKTTLQLAADLWPLGPHGSEVLNNVIISWPLERFC